ncbi:DUF4143 domain-containing protein [Eggerthellaceae bacterium zg-887]|nr:DUF4143 domain-containing protein [Xiamenia xianingshaonis]
MNSAFLQRPRPTRLCLILCFLLKKSSVSYYDNPLDAMCPQRRSGMQQGSLKPAGYLPRICDAQVSKVLDLFGAVEIAGPMWCGKTWTSLSFGESVTRLGRDAVKRIVEADPTTALLGKSPHVVDEWQDVPGVWDAVRDAVDEDGRPGRFILTGSSSLKKDAVSHSGAGRIAKLRMSTMTLLETGESSGAVSLSGLFDGRFEPILVQQTLEPLAKAICRGGWPALQQVPRSSSAYLDAYLDAVFDVSFPKRGLDSSVAWSVARSLARNAGTAAKLQTVASDAFGGEPSEAEKNAVSRYISAFESLYLVQPVSGWDAPIRSKSRLRTKPKRYFADPSLAASLLQADAVRLLSDGQLFGLLFESLCIHDLTVYASAVPGAPLDPLHYYRDSDGLEVDAVIELRDGRWAALEVKLGENKVPDGVRALTRLRKKVAANPAARNPDPSFMAVIVGAGEMARRDVESGVYVIPLTALGI